MEAFRMYARAQEEITRVKRSAYLLHYNIHNVSNQIKERLSTCLNARKPNALMASYLSSAKLAAEPWTANADVALPSIFLAANDIEAHLRMIHARVPEGTHIVDRHLAKMVEESEMIGDSGSDKSADEFDE
jgi:hypothetical protein